MCNGTEVNVKGPRGPAQTARNDSLRSALKSLQEIDPSSSPSIEWKDRTIKKAGEVVFTQEKDQLYGMWVGSMRCRND